MEGFPRGGAKVRRGERSVNGKTYNETLKERTSWDGTDGTRCMQDVITCAKGDRHAKNSKKKPVPLCEYLIKTYTNEKDIVLDCFMGVGSTGAACVRQKRSFIGIEKNKEFFDAADEYITLELAKRNIREVQKTQTQ